MPTANFVRQGSIVSALAIAIITATPVAAQNDNGAGIETHAFVSQGFILSSNNNYLTESKRGSFEFSEVAVNFTKQISDRLRTGIQLFSRDLGPIGNYSLKADWFYLDYRWRDWLGLRAGRVKLQFGLYNDISDVGMARLQILLPQSIYPIQNRDFLLAQTGVEIYGYKTLGLLGAVDYRLYGGSIYLDSNTRTLSGRMDRLTTSYVLGGRLLWETPVEGLRLGGSIQALKLDAQIVFERDDWVPQQMAGALPADFRGRVALSLPAVLGVGSVEYLHGDLQLAAEYSQWYLDLDSDTPALYPGSADPQLQSLKPVTSERFYALAAYRLHPLFQMGVYYSGHFTDIKKRNGPRDSYLHDIAATVRFDINEHWIFKLEGHLMDGTAGLAPGLNHDRRPSELARHWGVLLAKTTVYY